MAGVDSIEHGHYADRAVLQLMKSKGIYLVPTLSTVSPKSPALFDAAQQMMHMAKELGVKIADGSDASSVARHGKNAGELEAMTRGRGSAGRELWERFHICRGFADFAHTAPGAGGIGVTRLV